MGANMPTSATKAQRDLFEKRTVQKMYVHWISPFCVALFEAAQDSGHLFDNVWSCFACLGLPSHASLATLWVLVNLILPLRASPQVAS